MAQPAIDTEADLAASNDIKSLFSRFGEFSSASGYQEIVRNDNAYHAARRWPLLAEIQGIDPAAGEDADA